MSNKRPPMFLAEIIPEGEHHMKRIQRTLTSSELLALKTSPVQLLPSPGPGKRYAIFLALALYNFVTTPYTLNGGTDLQICNDATPAAALRVDGMITLSADTICAGTPVTGAYYASGAKDVPLKIANQGPAEFTAGDGTLLIVVYYTIEGDT